MKKTVLSLLLCGAFVLCCACAGNVPEPVSTPAAQSAEPAPESGGDNAGTVEPYPAAAPEEAVKFLTLMPPSAFGLAEPYENHEVRFIEETLVEGSDFYRMELEVSYPDSVEVLTLFIRTDLGAIYHYDDESGTYHEITPYDFYCPQESPKSNDPPEKPQENRAEGPQGYPEGGEDAAIAHLMRYNKAELNLPAELSEYVVRSDGEMEVNGIRCYDIGVYADLGQRMELMNTYWVAFDNSVVFATDLQTGGYKALPAK